MVIYTRSVVLEAGIKNRDASLHPTEFVGCNYLSLPLTPASTIVIWLIMSFFIHIIHLFQVRICGLSCPIMRISVALLPLQGGRATSHLSLTVSHKQYTKGFRIEHSSFFQIWCHQLVYVLQEYVPGAVAISRFLSVYAGHTVWHEFSFVFQTNR